MIRFLSFLLLTGLLLAGCSERKRSDPDAEEWVEIEAMADDAQVVPYSGTNETVSTVPAASDDGDAAFAAFIQRLGAMKQVTRRPGQTLLTGSKLELDQQARFVQMEGDVLVDDDQGQLRTDRLTGHFSALNEIEQVEAAGAVRIESGTRTAQAETAVYDYLGGTVQLDGQAWIAEGGNKLSGERIRFWINGARRMICEPNALLLIADRTGVDGDELPEDIGETEIRADRIVYDEDKGRADALGGVRLRNPQVAMNCGEIHLFLKDNNKIDWIEAVTKVIIQSEDRKALADKAIYEVEEAKFTLQGEPMVKQGRNVMTGDRIYFWHRTESVLCEPNGRIIYYYDLDAETQTRFSDNLNE